MTYLEKGDGPVEVDRISGSRKVIDGCLNCYYHAFPCGQCEEGKEGVVTYVEFRRRAKNGHELPERYEDFVADASHPSPVLINSGG